jgi:hypothetical protein
MRPRLSLRWMFFAFAVVACLLYLFGVRPTALANRFVAAVERHDYGAARRLLLADDTGMSREVNSLSAMPVSSIDAIYAEVLPCEMRDMFTATRRVVLRLARHSDENGRHTEWTEDTEIEALPDGLRIITPFGFRLEGLESAPNDRSAVDAVRLGST